MGQQRGLTGARVVAAILLSGLAPAGCSKQDEAEQQRDLLRGRDRSAELQAAAEKRRVRNAEGDLLPSDVKVAGIVIPRGFKQALEMPGAWYFDSSEPLAETEQYFTRRLTATRVSRNEQLELEFYQAREQADAQMKPAFVRVGRVPAQEGRTRIHVMAPIEQPPAPLSFEESKRQLEWSRKFAQ